ncbi:MAG: ACR3 family arsenite efflux transporter [Victivallaceae bacterium]
MSHYRKIKTAQRIRKIKQWSGFLDKYLGVGIILAVLTGIQLSHKFNFGNHLAKNLLLNHRHLPLMIGLIIMIYPSLARINYKKIGYIFRNLKILFLSLLQNWIIGPKVMFILAAVFLSGYPELMVGLIILGLARCISMVIVWDEIAKGDREYCAALVVFNSLFQIIALPFYAYFFVTWLPKTLGFFEEYISISVKEVALNLFIYLGIPAICGFITQTVFLKIKNERWYDKVLIPMITPITPLTLIITVFFIFLAKGQTFSLLPLTVVKIALPMILYFLIMFFSSFYLAYKTKVNYKQCITLSLTSASNNFELAIAICISLFGTESEEVLAVLIGSLIEIPVLITLIRIALMLKPKLFPKNQASVNK